MPCEFCKHGGNGSGNDLYRVPSPIVVKMLNGHHISCLTCGKDFSLKEIPQHEIECQQTLCANELCAIDMDHVAEQNRVRF